MLQCPIPIMNKALNKKQTMPSIMGVIHTELQTPMRHTFRTPEIISFSTSWATWVTSNVTSNTGWWFEPLWKIWKSIGRMTSHILWKIKKCLKPPTRIVLHKSSNPVFVFFSETGSLWYKAEVCFMLFLFLLLIRIDENPNAMGSGI